MQNFSRLVLYNQSDLTKLNLTWTEIQMFIKGNNLKHSIKNSKVLIWPKITGI